MRKTALFAGAGKAVLRFRPEYFPHEGFIDGHDDIFLRVLLLEQEFRGAIISVELPSIRPFSLVDGLRAYAGELMNVGPEHVWFVVTHNMSAPHVPQVTEADGERKQMLHIDMLREAIREAAAQAMASLQPVTVGLGSGLCDVNCNRDIRSKEGWWLGKDAPGPSDKTVSLIRLDSLSGEPVAILFNYAVKSAVIDDEVMADGYRHYTGDLTGRACRLAEEETGAVVIYFMAAAGDQVPKKLARYFATDEERHLYEIHKRDQAYAWAEELGIILGEKVIEIAQETTCDQMNAFFDMENRTMKFRGQYFVPAQKSHVPLLEYDYIPKEDTTLDVALLQIGDAILVGVKPEYTCLTGIQLRERSPYAQTMLCAMVNGGQGYMADALAYERLAYEGTHSEYAAGSAEEFVDRLGEVLDQRMRIQREGKNA